MDEVRLFQCAESSVASSTSSWSDDMMGCCFCRDSKKKIFYKGRERAG